MNKHDMKKDASKCKYPILIGVISFIFMVNTKGALSMEASVSVSMGALKPASNVRVKTSH